MIARTLWGVTPRRAAACLTVILVKVVNPFRQYKRFPVASLVGEEDSSVPVLLAPLKPNHRPDLFRSVDLGERQPALADPVAVVVGYPAVRGLAVSDAADYRSILQADPARPRSRATERVGV